MIDSQTKNRVCYISLSRAEKRNALNDEMVSALKSAFTNAYANNDCKVIVLQAQGDVFSAGADLGYLQQLQENTFEENVEDSSELASLFKLIYTGPKVVVASVQGHAIAGGCGLATVCDFSFAKSEAKFGYTEVKIGFIPAIVSYFLLRKIGEVKTKEMLLTGKLITANEAKEVGLINYVVEENLEEEVNNFCQELILNCSEQSLAKTKELIANLNDKNVDEAMVYTAQMNAKARATQDCKSGISAFLNKEKIQW